jgi:GNAT superfamily N-acetyltransferase
MSERAGIEVSLLEPTAGDDACLVERLTTLVNDVYAEAEAGLWRDGATRTTPAQIAELIGRREIAVATVDGGFAGTVRVWPVSRRAAEFGMLTTDPEHRGRGAGGALIDFAERHARELGLRTMQLELLVPRSWRHPMKVFLDEWYRRLGYRPVRTTDVDETEPELAPLLATPCKFVVYCKTLGGESAAAASASATSARD